MLLEDLFDEIFVKIYILDFFQMTNLFELFILLLNFDLRKKDT